MTDYAGFVQNQLPFAISASAQTGLPVDFIIGQAALESGWGTSSLAQNNNNFFGMGGPGNFASYPNASNSYSAWGNWVNSHLNTTALAGGGATDIANAMVGANYTHDPGYAQSVGATTSTVDKILSGLGLGQYAGGTAGAGTGQTASGASSGGGDWLSRLEAWFSNIAGSVTFVVVGVVILIAALFMFAKQSGVLDNLPKAVPIPV